MRNKFAWQMRNWSAALLFALLLLLASCAVIDRAPAQPADFDDPQISIVVEGLLGPVGLAALPDGSLLVAEEGTGGRNDSAGVTLITRDGDVGRLISGLPSTRDAGDLAGVPLVQLGPDGDTLYVGSFGAGHLWTLDLATAFPNGDIALPEQPFLPDDLGRTLLPLNSVRLANPFDLTFDRNGLPVATDASGNGVATQNADGTARFIHRFDALPNPLRASDAIQAVPTGLTLSPRDDLPGADEEYLVTLFGGCPYPDGSGQLVAIDAERGQRTLLDNLSLPIDVAQGPDGTLWLLEFARFTRDASCFDGSGYQRETGRLSRLVADSNGDLQPQAVLENLNFPGAVLPAADGSLYLSDVLGGRVLHVTFGKVIGTRKYAELALSGVEGLRGSEGISVNTSERIEITDMDGTLRRVIEAHDLQADPGATVREGETALSTLGQLLFFDPLLSGDRNVSCATCHHPALAMADGRALPIGTGGFGLGPGRDFNQTVALEAESIANPFFGQFIPRNSPTIINSALLTAQFWDGRVQGYANQAITTQDRAVNELGISDALAGQALFPVTSLHEMAGTTLGNLPSRAVRTRLLDRLRANDEYAALFTQTFEANDSSDKGSDAITLPHVAEALAAFERRFVFTDAPWDGYIAGDEKALSEQQKRGALLFWGAREGAVNCASCHVGDLFTDLSYHNLLVPQLGPGKGQGESAREDWGRAAVTFDWRDRYRFRTPSLRNVALTAPYFHSGAYDTLEATIRHHADVVGSAAAYDPSAQGVPSALYSSVQPYDPRRQATVAPALRNGLPLGDADIADLVAYLQALTDPAARDLGWAVPPSVPSGLALDEVSEEMGSGDVGAQGQPVEESALGNVEGESAPRDAAATDVLFRDVAAEVGLDFRHGAFAMGVSQDPVAAMGGGLCWLDYDRDGWLDLYVVNSRDQRGRRGDAERPVGITTQGDVTSSAPVDEATSSALQALGAAGSEANAPLPTNALYHNVAGTFVDVSSGSAADLALRGNGCIAADLDDDGWTDIFITADGPNKLLWNNGDGTFREGAEAAGLDAPEWNSAAAAGDLNGDGRIDLFVAAYIDLNKTIPKPVGAFPQDYYGLPDRLYLNLGADAQTGRATFREVALEAGLARAERGLGAIFSDLDLDGDLDLYVANDGHPNRLYANQPLADDPEGLGFRLVDLSATAAVGDAGSGMGVASGDYDGDGWPDLFVTNWERELNALYRNKTREAGQLTFQYSTFRIGLMGLGNGQTGWGTHLADFDHDTDEDLLIVNGRVPVTNLATDPEPVRFYRNRSWSLDESGTLVAGPRVGHFLDHTDVVGLAEVGERLGRGSAAADYDNDGDLDVAINVIGGQLVLLHNSASERQAGRWLEINLGGIYPGARATVTLPDGRQLVRELHVGSSYLASEDARLHFGLGSLEQVPSVLVRWPDGSERVLENVATNQRINVRR